jgi:hypothetical protein
MRVKKLKIRLEDNRVLERNLKKIEEALRRIRMSLRTATQRQDGAPS